MASSVADRAWPLTADYHHQYSVSEFSAKGSSQSFIDAGTDWDPKEVFEQNLDMSSALVESIGSERGASINCLFK